MSADKVDPWLPHVRCVRRRLVLQSLGHWLILLGAPLLILSALVLVVLSRARFRGLPEEIADSVVLTRLLWVGVGFGVTVVAALVVAIVRRPSRLEAALRLDGAFGLKERVTTCLALSDAERETPAGRAVLVDAQKQIEKVHVPDAFPLSPSRRAALLPAGLLAALLAVVFCDPRTAASMDDDSGLGAQPLAKPDEIAKRLEQLAPKKPAGAREKPKEARVGGDDDADLQRLAGERPTTRDEARDVLKDLTSAEERMRRREKALADRAEALRQQAQEADRLSRKSKQPQEKPDSKLDDALRRGDLQAAADELERLSRQLEKQDLTDEQRKELSRQVEDLRDKLDRMTELAEKGNREQDKLDREEQEQGGLDAEQIEQMALKKALRDQDLEELKEIVAELKEAGEKLDGDENKEAAKALVKAGEKMGKLDGEGEQQGLAAKLAKVESVKQAIAKQLGGPRPASGKRPEAKEGETGEKETQAVGERAPGKITGLQHVPGAGLKTPKTPAEMKASLDDATREATERLDRQPLSRSAADTVRGYYEKLREPDGDR